MDIRSVVVVIGVVLFFAGIGLLLQVSLDAFIDGLSPRSKKLAEIRQKEEAGQELSKHEKIEVQMVRVNRMMPKIGACCLAAALLAAFLAAAL